MLQRRGARGSRRSRSAVNHHRCSYRNRRSRHYLHSHRSYHNHRNSHSFHSHRSYRSRPRCRSHCSYCSYSRTLGYRPLFPSRIGSSTF